MPKDEEKKRMETTRRTPLEISHTMFRKGYQEGRQDYFQYPYIMTDEDLVIRIKISFERSEHKNDKKREEDLHYLIGKLVGEMYGCVLPRQPDEACPRDQPNQESLPATQQLPLKIAHPLFWKGYQEGRKHYFQEQYMLTDDALVTCLGYSFEPGPYKNAEHREEDLYSSIGHLVGEMHGCVLPLQPHEERARALQEAFLAKVIPEDEARGKTLVKTIRLFWIVQDQLAQTLDTNSFEEMINCCRDLGNSLAVVEA
jgi:hypothetical protein